MRVGEKGVVVAWRVVDFERREELRGRSRLKAPTGGVVVVWCGVVWCGVVWCGGGVVWW